MLYRDDGKERSGSFQPSLSFQRRYTEVFAPSAPAPSRFTAKWAAALPRWGSFREETDSRKRLPRAVKVYYRQQKKDLDVLQLARKVSYLGEEEVKQFGDRFPEGARSKGGCTPKSVNCSCAQLSVGTAARLTLSVNFLLFFLKFAATIQSGSLAVLSSLIDSGLDLFSGAAIAVSSYLIKRYDRFHYPIGRNRLEPVAIIITAAVMGTAAFQIITSSIEDISEGSVDPNINIFSGFIIFLTVILKGLLYFLCKKVHNPSVQALAVDHRNDVVSNFVTLIFGILGTYVYSVIDPIGAILIAFYIIINWILVGYEQLKNLVGHTANRLDADVDCSKP